MQGDPVCAYCEKPGELHRDHVVPRSRGGPDNATNIVMACQSCNQSKTDKLPSEWLGDRCPSRVLVIEARVHAKLKGYFSKRDRKNPVKDVAQPTLFAYSLGEEHGLLEYSGAVVSETETTLRLEVHDGVMLYAGALVLSGELRDIPRSRCRIFNDKDAFIGALGRESDRLNRHCEAQFKANYS